MLTIRHLNSPETVLLRVEAHTLDGHDFTGADLSHAALAHASCREAVFRSATLRAASLRGAILERADFTGADLGGADLFCSDLQGAVLRRADLSGANLHGADLRGVDFFGALLSGTDLTDVICDERTRWPAGMADCPVPRARTGSAPACGGGAGKSGETAPWWNGGPRDARWSALVGAAVLLSVLTVASTSRVTSVQGRAGSPRAGAVQPGAPPAPSPVPRASLPQLAQNSLTLQQETEPGDKAPVRKIQTKRATPIIRRRSALPAIGYRRTVRVLRHPSRPRRTRTGTPARPLRLVRYAEVRRARRTHRSVTMGKPYQAPSPAWYHGNWFPEREPAPVATAAGSPAAQARLSRPRRRKPRAAGAEPKATASGGNSDIHYGSGYDSYRMNFDRSK